MIINNVEMSITCDHMKSKRHELITTFILDMFDLFNDLIVLDETSIDLYNPIKASSTSYDSTNLCFSYRGNTDIKDLINKIFNNFEPDLMNYLQLSFYCNTTDEDNDLFKKQSFVAWKFGETVSINKINPTTNWIPIIDSNDKSKLFLIQKDDLFDNYFNIITMNKLTLDESLTVLRVINSLSKINPNIINLNIIIEYLKINNIDTSCINLDEATKYKIPVKDGYHFDNIPSLDELMTNETVND